MGSTFAGKSAPKRRVDGEHASLRRPFDPKHLAIARELATQYKLVIEHDPDSKCYIGRTIELPSTYGEGATVESCVRDTIKATIASICTMLEMGKRPPSPSREGTRDQQLNVRLSSDEKLVLEAAAERDGFRSVSDFVRSAALKAS